MISRWCIGHRALSIVPHYFSVLVGELDALLEALVPQSLFLSAKTKTLIHHLSIVPVVLWLQVAQASGGKAGPLEALKGAAPALYQRLMAPGVQQHLDQAAAALHSGEGKCLSHMSPQLTITALSSQPETLVLVRVRQRHA